MSVIYNTLIEKLHSLKYKSKTARAYGIVFGHIKKSANNKFMDSNQRRVLADLATFCQSGWTSHTDDPNALSRATGRLEVYNHIINNIDCTDFEQIAMDVRKTQEEINNVRE